MTRRDNHILILIDAQSSSCLSRYRPPCAPCCATAANPALSPWSAYRPGAPDGSS